MVERKLVDSRSRALQLIKDEQIYVNEVLIKKSSFNVTEDDKIEIKEEFPYVGRGALKLEGAFEAFKLDFTQKIIADIGASTGGFTDFSLQHGAKKVYAIDVGHDQLAQKLRNDGRVINLEGKNIREGVELPEKVDMIVSDLSYISLRLVIDEMAKLLVPYGEMVLLFKPQFEVGRDNIGKNGIVKNFIIIKKVLNEFWDDLIKKELHPQGLSRSPIKGKTGNQEYLIYIKYGPGDDLPFSKVEEQL